MGTVSSSTSTASGSVSGFFYSPSANALTIQPSQSDSVSIPENIYNECEAAMAGGSTIQNFNGLPMIVNPVSLTQAQASQIAALQSAYQAAIQVPVSYTSKGGVTKTFQADPVSVANLQAAIAGFAAAGTTPSGFYWGAADNTQVPFTYADLQGLAAAMIAQGWAEFQHLQTQKAAVNAATTVAAVQAITF